MTYTWKEFKKLVKQADAVSFSVQISVDDETQIFMSKRQFLKQLEGEFEFNFVFAWKCETVESIPEGDYDIVVDRFGNQSATGCEND